MCLSKTIEVWKDIDGFYGYQVSNLGNVRTFKIRNSKELRDVPNLLKPNKIKSNKKYYLGVRLRHNNVSKSIYIHRLVANAFIENTGNKPCVNHIDNNPFNNKVDNLEWVTDKENKHHAIFIGAYRSGSLVLDKETGIYYNSIPDAARYKNINKNSLRAMLIGQYNNKTSLELV